MRLFHKDLIEVLPRQQLLGQWRELNSIFKLQNRHILINFVYDYDFGHLLGYTNMVIAEMENRGYKMNLENARNYFDPLIRNAQGFKMPFYENLFKEKMNDRYLKQCLYNLQEKYDCGGISHEEWQKIEDKFGGYL